MYRVCMIICLLGVLVGCGIDDQPMFPSDSTQPTKTIQHPSGGRQTTAPKPTKTVAQPKSQVGDTAVFNPLWEPENPQPLPKPLPLTYREMDVVQDVRNDPAFRDTNQLSVIGEFQISNWTFSRSIMVTELHRTDGSINYAALLAHTSDDITSINTMSYQFPGLKAQTLIAEIDGTLFIVGRVDNELKDQTDAVVVDRFVDATYPSEVRAKAVVVEDGFFVIPIEVQERDAWQYLTHIRLLDRQKSATPLQDLNFHGPFAYDQGITTIN